MKGIGNWGGHLLNPPVHCGRRFKAPDGAIWCDLANCFYCKEPCDHYKWFKKAKQEERDAYWTHHGVRTFYNSSDKSIATAETEDGEIITIAPTERKRKQSKIETIQRTRKRKE